MVGGLCIHKPGDSSTSGGGLNAFLVNLLVFKALVEKTVLNMDSEGILSFADPGSPGPHSLPARV